MNSDIIKELVRNNFSLSTEGFRVFKDRLKNQVIDETFKGILDDDLRARIDVDDTDLALVDPGWKSFSMLGAFIGRFGITYKDFLSGFVMVEKNRWKITKLAVKYYVEEEVTVEKYYNICDTIPFYHIDSANNTYSGKTIEPHLVEFISRCLGMKMKSGIQLVLSLNFADWFLCSTGESWTSCLDLESDFDGCYWTGLPGTIVDENRALLYFTGGRKKDYLGISVDKIISRSWCLLDKKSHLNIIKFYPNELCEIEKIAKILEENIGIKAKKIRLDFKSKNKLNLIDFTSGDSSFIYQDGTTFYRKSIVASNNIYGGGYYYFNRSGNMCREELFNYSGGLENLDNSDHSIDKYLSSDSCFYCASCGDRFPQSEMYSFDDESYCECCFTDNFFYCEECGCDYENDKMMEVDGEIMCRDCYDKNFVECELCRGICSIDDIVEDSCGRNICMSCLEEKYIECEDCYDIVLKEEAVKNHCLACYTHHHDKEKEAV